MPCTNLVDLVSELQQSGDNVGLLDLVLLHQAIAELILLLERVAFLLQRLQRHSARRQFARLDVCTGALFAQLLLQTRVL